MDDALNRKLCAGLNRVRPFLIAADWTPGGSTDRLGLREQIAPQPKQVSLL